MADDDLEPDDIGEEPPHSSLAGLGLAALIRLLDQQEDEFKEDVRQWLFSVELPLLEPQIEHALHAGVSLAPVIPVNRYEDIFEQWSSRVYDLGTQAAVREVGLSGWFPPPGVNAPILRPVDASGPESRFVPWDAVQYAKDRAGLQGAWSRDLDASVQQTVSEAIHDGFTVPQLKAKLKTVFTDFVDNRLNTIARTETTAAFNAGRQVTFERVNRLSPPSPNDKDALPFVAGQQWVSVLDGRTTVYCANGPKGRNGRILAYNDPLLVRNNPPGHYNCRSLWSPITRIQWRKLAANDAATIKRILGWTKFASLDEATDWKSVAPFPDGWGMAA